MRKSTRRKLKVYAVDAAMILLAAQVTVVLKADNKAEASTYTTIQAIQDEQAETGSDAETLENDTKYISASEDEPDAYCYMDCTDGEYLPCCGGGWSGTSSAGVFDVSLYYPRSDSSAYIGFRSAYYGKLDN